MRSATGDARSVHAPGLRVVPPRLSLCGVLDIAGNDVAQLYLHDPVASISQPVRRLRGFEQVTLEPGKSKTVRFTLDASDFGFYDNRGKFVVEPGAIQVLAGNDSTASLTKTFEVKR